MALTDEDRAASGTGATLEVARLRRIEWARTHFARYLESPILAACPVCGMTYVREVPEDRRVHRSYHRRIVAVFEPARSAALAKEFATHGRFIPVREDSSRFLRYRLYEIARIFKFERGYDFIPWDEAGDDGHGYLISDEEGRALGGAVVRWREYSDHPPEWGAAWVWIAPPFRRLGLLRALWAMCSARYRGIIPEPPFSPAVAAFVLGRSEFPERILQAAHQVLADSEALGPGER